MPDYHEEQFAKKKDENEKAFLKREGDWATQAACDMQRVLEEHGLIDHLSYNTQKWIKKHKEEDAAREIIENEAKKRADLRRAAIAKLTTEELQELGIVDVQNVDLNQY